MAITIRTTLPFQNHEQIIMTNSSYIMDEPIPIEKGGSDRFWGGLQGPAGQINVLSAGALGGDLVTASDAAMTYIIGASGGSGVDDAKIQGQFGNTDTASGSLTAIGFAFTYLSGQTGVSNSPTNGTGTRVIFLSTGINTATARGNASHTTLFTSISDQFTGSLLFSNGGHLTYAIPPKTAHSADRGGAAATPLSAITHNTAHGPVFEGASDPHTRRQVHMGYR